MSKKIWLYGEHVVREVLKNPKRRIHEVIGISPERYKIPQRIKQRQVSKQVLDKMFPSGSVHQGIAVCTDMLENLDLEHYLRSLSNKKSVFLILDQVTDPHNIGALLRSAQGFYADGVIIPSHHSPEESAILAKCASGALEHVPLIRVSNIVRAIEVLKKHSFWTIGLSLTEKAQDIRKINMPERTAFILGSEGKGMRNLTEKSCDYLGFIPMNPTLESYNVSNAGAIVLYNWVLAHK